MAICFIIHIEIYLVDIGISAILHIEIIHPLVQAAAAEFSGFEEGTLRFFDAVLPGCAKMVDFGAYVGFTALYAATHVETVFAFEPSPVNHELLARNVAVNPELASRIHLFRHGLGARDEQVMLYAKGMADFGASIFQDIERRGVVSGTPEAAIALRNAAEVLREVGLDRRTLLKIDIEGRNMQCCPPLRRCWRNASRGCTSRFIRST